MFLHCHHSMVCVQVTDGWNGLHIRSISVNILKKVWIADKGWHTIHFYIHSFVLSNIKHRDVCLHSNNSDTSWSATVTQNPALIALAWHGSGLEREVARDFVRAARGMLECWGSPSLLTRSLFIQVPPSFYYSSFLSTVHHFSLLTSLFPFQYNLSHILLILISHSMSEK